MNPDGLQRLREATAKLWRPRTRLKPSEWADLNAYLPRSGGQPEPGKYRTGRCPYQRDMLDDPVDPSVMETIWIMASQMGKTVCEVLVVEYFIDQDPTSILVVYPKIDDAKSWMRSKFMPHIEATPKLKGIIKPSRWRDSENTMLYKKFPGGELDAAGANSPSTLRQRSKRVVILDELDGYEPNSEGDPEEQADRRTENFSNAVKLKSTTVTIDGLSRGQKKFDASDKQFWFVRCPKCNHEQTLLWKNVRWPEGKPEEAWLRCDNDACGAELTDTDRIRMVMNGRWKATAPFRGYRGRHLSGLYRVMGLKDAYQNYLHEFVEGFLRAKRKGKLSLMVWVNTFLCETFKLEDVERLSGINFITRREDYDLDTVPEPALVVTCGVDVQGDRLEALSKAWGPGEESWGLEYRIFPGNPLQVRVWKDWLEWLQSARYRTTDEREMRILCTAVDSGFHTDTVYEICRPLFNQRIHAIKGSSQTGSPIVGTLTRNNRRRCPVYTVGVHSAKLTIYSRLQIESAGPGFYHYPARPELRFDEAFFSGLTSEEITTKISRGFPQKVFTLPEGRRNEPLDLEVYSLAALGILNPAWAALKKQAGHEETGELVVADQPIRTYEKPSASGDRTRRQGRGQWRRRRNWIRNY